jgi:VWFA-related protein
MPLLRTLPRPLSCLITLLTLAAVSGAQQNPPPTFRANVDLIQLDVSVLDKAHQPVRGLTAADFTVLVDGVPRAVIAFKAVELPKPVPPSAPWIRDITPDVATNAHPSGRVVVIMIDDASFFNQVDADLWAVQKTRAVARAALNELGADDLAAVVYTENNHTAQNFTTDRRRLLAAIDRSAIFPGRTILARGDDSPMPAITPAQAEMLNDPLGITRGSCSCGVCSIEALGRVAEALRSLPQQRKIVVYISAGVVVTPPKTQIAAAGYENMAEHCNLVKRDAMTEAFRQAQLSNVTIEAVDPKGVIAGGEGASSRVEFLRTMAETTGGRAVVNRNDMDQQVPALLAESSSYYLLGVESPITTPGTKEDGRLHPIQVRVARSDLEVRTRTGYYTPTAKERKAMAARPSRSLDMSIAAALPKADFPMEVSVAPFAAANRQAELAVVLAVTQPNNPSSRNESGREGVDVLISAFNPETGTALGSWRQALNVGWNPAAAVSGQYEVMSRIPVKSGRYELRLGARTADGRTASVYTYVEVPDFSGDSLSLSGLVLSAIPSPRMATAPKDAFAGLLPIAPTARRAFRTTDRVTGFLRVYQGGTRPVMPLTLTTRLVDSTNAQRGGGVRNIDAASFGPARSYDDRFDLPVRLPPGEYLLTIDAAAGGKTAQRAVRFSVRQP